MFDLFASHPGKFIVIEGMDGAGTTSLTRMMAQTLPTKSSEGVLSTSEPSDPHGHIGAMIRRMLNGHVNLMHGEKDPVKYSDLPHFGRILTNLFAADRFDHLDREVIPAMELGKTVLCDRYVYSSFVYQGDWSDVSSVSDLMDFGNLDVLRTVMAANEGILVPDLVICLELPWEVAAQRLIKRKSVSRELVTDQDVFETEAKMRVHADRYRWLFGALELGLIHHGDTRIARIDATRPIEDVFDQAMRHVSNI